MFSLCALCGSETNTAFELHDYHIENGAVNTQLHINDPQIETFELAEDLQNFIPAVELMYA